MKLENISLPSNQKFGFFFTVVFALVSIYFYSGKIDLVIIVFGGLTFLTFFLSIVKPALLLPFNKLWMRFGILLGMIISPIVLGLIFYGLITPISVTMRLFGRDELRLKMINRTSHWKTREPVGPEPTSFKNQF